MNTTPHESKRDVLTLTGVVLECHRGDFYRVDCAAGSLKRTVLARRSGRLLKNSIRILPGDRVRVEVSPYDLSRGRVTYRLKEGES